MNQGELFGRSNGHGANPAVRGAIEGILATAATQRDALDQTLERFSQGVRAILGEEAWRSWGADLTTASVDAKVVRLAAPSRTHQERLMDRVGARKLKQIWKDADPMGRELHIEVASPRPDPAPASSSSTSSTPPAANARRAEAPGARPSAPPRPQGGPARDVLAARGSFDNLVVGDANRVAVSAARAIAAGVDEPFRLGLFHGSYGAGKTHTLSAIEQALIARDVKVIYYNADRYRAEYVKSLKSASALAFKDAVAEAEVLLVDDLHLLQGSKATQGELAAAISEVLSRGGRVVLAASAAAAEINGLEPRLAARLESAVNIKIGKPDQPLRRRILERMVDDMPAARRAGVPYEVLDFIASAVPETPRALEAALGAVITRTALIGAEVTLENAKVALNEMSGGSNKRITVEEIQKIVASYHGIKVPDLLSKRRSREIVRPRQEAMFLCKEFTTRSLPDIGRRFGNFDHTTVMHACRRIAELFSKEAAVRSDIETLRRMLRERRDKAPLH